MSKDEEIYRLKMEISSWVRAARKILRGWEFAKGPMVVPDSQEEFDSVTEKMEIEGLNDLSELLLGNIPYPDLSKPFGDYS